jgi:hypothetical protein
MSIELLLEKGSKALAKVAHEILLEKLNINRSDFITAFTEVFMEMLNKSQQLARQIAESLFQFYLENIVLDNDRVVVRDLVHKQSGLSLVTVVGMYEYGIATIPPNPIWSTISDHRRYNDLLNSIKNELDVVL